MNAKNIFFMIGMLIMSFAAQCGDNLVVWKDAANEEGYVVERSDDFVNFSEIAQLSKNETSYTDLDLTPGLYVYHIKELTNKGVVSNSFTEQVLHVE